MNLREGTRRHFNAHRVWLEPSYEYVRADNRRRLRREQRQANLRLAMWMCFTGFTALALTAGALGKLLRGLI